MNWVTIIWVASGAVSLTLGAVHFGVWLQNRGGWANLFFSITALSVAAFAGCSLAVMHAQTVEGYIHLHRWGHVPVFVTVAALIGFVWCFFGTGRPWLAWTVIAL